MKRNQAQVLALATLVATAIAIVPTGAQALSFEDLSKSPQKGNFTVEQMQQAPVAKSDTKASQVNVTAESNIDAMAEGYHAPVNGIYTDPSQIYFVENGKKLTGWCADRYFDSTAKMVTGWKEIDGQWYYFYLTGKKAKLTMVDGYYLNGTGVIAQIGEHDRVLPQLVIEGDKKTLNNSEFSQYMTQGKVHVKTSSAISGYGTHQYGVELWIE